MGDRRLKILQVSIADSLGGGEKLAWDQFDAYRALGHTSWLAVGYKTGTDPDILQIPNPRVGGRWQDFWPTPHPSGSRWYDFWSWLGEKLAVQEERRAFPGLPQLRQAATFMSRPLKRIDELLGHVDFRFPGTWKLLDLPPEMPDIIHCHNLHFWYFDLRALPWLSRQRPVILSMHDAWLLSGLCCHSFDCDRWKDGCGQCPYLDAWRANLERDGTAYNWKRKKSIYARSRLRVTSACKWVMDRVDQSILAAGIVEKRIIPYGVDLSVFHPAVDKEALRSELGLPSDALVLLFVGRTLGNNQSKDYATLRAGVDLAARWRPHRRIVLICRGGELPPERYDNVDVLFQPWGSDFTEPIRFYQACDVYVHAARIDTFPLSVMEAMGCGAPVIGTAVGGIPEQIKSLGPEAGGIEGVQYPAEEATGILVAPQNAERLGQAIATLLDDDQLRRQMSVNAHQDAHKRFSLNRQIQDYLHWYEEIVNRDHENSHPLSSAAS
jgi:glycosyltransferase involved in cell wall biosynthesis